MASRRSQLLLQANRGDFLGTLGGIFGKVGEAVGAVREVLTGGGGTREAEVLSPAEIAAQTFPGQRQIKESGIVTGLARAVPAVAGAIGRAAAKPGVIKNVGKLLAAGLVFEAGGLIFDSVTGQLLGKKPRRRMNVLNPRALSRATRRLAGFEKRSAKVEKVLRKLAPPARRRRVSHDLHHDGVHVIKA